MEKIRGSRTTGAPLNHRPFGVHSTSRYLRDVESYLDTIEFAALSLVAFLRYGHDVPRN